MLPLDDIQRMRETVDADWRSPVADAVSRPWGIASGSARWLRSSSTHVFVVRDAQDGQLPAFLRFAPRASAAGRKLASSAGLMAEWARRGILVVQPIGSRRGVLSEAAGTELGDMAAMLVPAAAGEEVDVEGLTEARAAGWGAALGALHREGTDGVPASGIGPASPLIVPDEVRDPEFAGAVEAIADELRRLDPRVHSSGICHGDFELDNLRFSRGVPTFFDADEAHVGWFAGDVAFAVRDLTGVTAFSEPKPALLAAFLVGYRAERTFTAEEESSLPLHSAAASAHLVLDVTEALAPGSNGVPADSLPALRETLREHVEWHRRRVLEWHG